MRFEEDKEKRTEVKKKISEHLSEIMKLLEIEETPSNEGTPNRVAKMWVDELFVNRNDEYIEDLDSKMKLFPNEYNNEVVIMRDIEFNSMCEHHWLPFSGKITVAYVPKENVIGLSKIPRVVKYFSKKPTLQEKLGKDIAQYLFEILKPEMLVVYVKSTHSCVKCRGAESDCETVTSFSIQGTPTSEEDAKYYLFLREQIDKRVGEF